MRYYRRRWIPLPRARVRDRAGAEPHEHDLGGRAAVPGDADRPLLQPLHDREQHPRARRRGGGGPRVGPRREVRVGALDALIGITVTGIVFATILAPDQERIELSSVLLHYVSPPLALLLWLVLGPCGARSWRVIGAALLWPLAYLVWTVGHGAISDRYPYGFIDAGELGAGRMLRTACSCCCSASRTASWSSPWIAAARVGSVPAMEPELPLTGACGCGAVRFEIDAPLTGALYCHCTRCQRRTGAAASVTGRIVPGSLRVTAGEEHLRDWKPEGGMPKTFCVLCGSGVLARTPEGEWRGVRLGALDADPGVRPSFHQFTDYAVAWEPIPDDGLPRHPERAPA